MAKIKNTYPNPAVSYKMRTVEELGYTEKVKQLKQQIQLAIQKGGSLFHVAQELEQILADNRDMHVL